MQCSCTPKYDHRDLPAELLDMTNRHPCYSFGAHHKFARMHLPVAPQCNISCNYCNRKFDCVNESRPGVTSEVLTPRQAYEKYLRVREKVENLSVVGIAGPGDALANWEETRLALEMIRKADPEVIFCLSTNGLLLPDYAREIIDLGINHVTVTVNCLEPEIGAMIYQRVKYRGKNYQDQEGASILINNQLEGIQTLAGQGALVKVNTVMIKDINDQHIPEVVKKAGELGAFMGNIMPLIPAPGSLFENYPQTSQKELLKMRVLCQFDLKQMNHCRQCRADAIGLLGHDRSIEFSSATAIQNAETGLFGAERSGPREGLVGKEYRIAVASKHGKLVDQHFGYASEFAIYQGNGEAFQLVEKRQVGQYCTGVEECGSEEDPKEAVVNALKDCDAVLTMRIGYHAKERLLRKGILSVESCDTVENALIYAAKKLDEREVA